MPSVSIVRTSVCALGVLRVAGCSGAVSTDTGRCLSRRDSRPHHREIGRQRALERNVSVRFLLVRVRRVPGAIRCGPWRRLAGGVVVGLSLVVAHGRRFGPEIYPARSNRFSSRMHRAPATGNASRSVGRSAQDSARRGGDDLNEQAAATTFDKAVHPTARAEGSRRFRRPALPTARPRSRSRVDRSSCPSSQRAPPTQATMDFVIGVGRAVVVTGDSTATGAEGMRLSAPVRRPTLPTSPAAPCRETLTVPPPTRAPALCVPFI